MRIGEVDLVQSAADRVPVLADPGQQGVRGERELVVGADVGGHREPPAAEDLPSRPRNVLVDLGSHRDGHLVGQVQREQPNQRATRLPASRGQRLAKPRHTVAGHRSDLLDGPDAAGDRHPAGLLASQSDLGPRQALTQNPVQGGEHASSPNQVGLQPILYRPSTATTSCPASTCPMAGSGTSSERNKPIDSASRACSAR